MFEIETMDEGGSTRIFRAASGDRIMSVTHVGARRLSTYYTPEAARELAAALVKLADETEGK
ncbi:hypothetical protein [Streptomyces sp. NPDC088183]|uniref:hypothetical protein n=1 Tax=Streptomyces sp. NPDC088183 TaxID=3160992 RepID=UPI00343B12E5